MDARQKQFENRQKQFEQAAEEAAGNILASRNVLSIGADAFRDFMGENPNLFGRLVYEAVAKKLRQPKPRKKHKPRKGTKRK